MPGSFDLDTGGAGLAGYAAPIAVYAYDPDAGPSLLPNVWCLRVDRREGGHPCGATFRYVFDDTMAATYGWPNRVEQVFGVYNLGGPYVVQPDQRLLVMGQYPDGSPWLLFDGFAQVGQADVIGGRDGGASKEAAQFTAIGVEVRCWDNPILGSVWRSAAASSTSDTSGNSDVETDLPAHFNPSVQGPGVQGGQLANCTSKGYDTGAGGATPAPRFIDPRIQGRDPAPNTVWHVGPAVRYVLDAWNDGTYVTQPDFSTLDSLLRTYRPAAGHDTMDPADSSTYTVAPVPVPDTDVSGLAWPDAVARLVSYCGFLVRFDTYWAGAGPETDLVFYRRDEFAPTAPKSLYLQAAGAALDLTQTNVLDAHLACDVAAVVNAYQVETAQRRVEVSWILEPLYEPATDDAQAANRPTYWSNNLADAGAATRRKYRWYGADECGDGHWVEGADGGAGAWSTSPADFSAIFPPDSDGTPSYAVRYRPGAHTLLSTDDDGYPLRADLSISFDYAGPPGAWDGSGTWQSIRGGWRLLRDRLGIEVTAHDPEQWSVGQGQAIAAGGPAGAEIVPGGAIRGITWWADPPAGGPTNGAAPTLRLTTVIEDDLRLEATAGKRLASPTAFTRWRVADRRDQFLYAAVDTSSMNYAEMALQPDARTNAQLQVVVRDDTARATALAAQLRSAHEMPTVSGRVVIPYLTDYYAIGDRLDMIAGRGALLQTNIAGDQGEGPSYPWVVGVSWVLDGGQSTELTLSDAAAVPRHHHWYDRRAAVRHA